MAKSRGKLTNLLGAKMAAEISAGGRSTIDSGHVPQGSQMRSSRNQGQRPGQAPNPRRTKRTKTP